MNLTDGEQRCLEAVRRIGADGWPVSVREVQRELGYASTQTAHGLLASLELKGLLTTSPRSGRRSGWRA